MRFLFLSIFVFISFLGQAQKESSQVISDLNFYSDAMINAESYTNRLRAHDQFSKLFKETLYQKNSWDLKLESIPFIHCIVSPDSLFKIYTYNISDNKKATKETGYIQMRSGEIFDLKPTNYFSDIEYNENTYDDWVSGIYYHMIPFEKEGEKMYLLFSFSQPTAYQKRKVIDVLRFVDGKPVFGAEVFIEKVEGARDKVKTRRLYKYSADVSMVIQYDDQFNSILIDHLMEVKSRIPGSTENTAVPDGTYTSYHFEQGNWIYKDMVFDPVKTPAENNSENKPQQGLFGKSKKSKN